VPVIQSSVPVVTVAVGRSVVAVGGVPVAAVMPVMAVAAVMPAMAVAAVMPVVAAVATRAVVTVTVSRTVPVPVPVVARRVTRMHMSHCIFIYVCIREAV